MKRHVTTAVVMAGLLAACSSDDEAVTSTSTGTTTPTTEAIATVPEIVPSTTEPFEPESPPDRLVGAYRLELPGAFAYFSQYLELSPSGDGRVLTGGENAEEIHFPFEVDGERLRITSADGSWGCDAADVGLYEWVGDGRSLTLTLVADQCAARANDLLAPRAIPGTAAEQASWISLGDTPIIQVTGARAPVKVESPIGTIEWMPNEVDAGPGSDHPFAGALVGGDDGFFTLQATADGVAVMHSSDGLSWSALPSPPEAPEYLTVLGDTVTVVAGLFSGGSYVGAWPTQVYSTTDLGATWNQVAVDPAPLGAGLHVLASVGGGVGTLVLTRSGDDAEAAVVGPIWLGSPGRLELVEPPFVGATGGVAAWALDSSFLVHAGTGYGINLAGTWWTSADGRSWTLIEDVPCGLDVTSTEGDTVYGMACRDIPVISLDGGLTWGEGGFRPTGRFLFPESGGELVVEGGAGWVCGQSVSASADGELWQPVFVPWPAVFGDAAASGDTILLRTNSCDAGTGTPTVLDFVGTIDAG